MSQYWLMDAQGLVLGPVGLQVLKDLAAHAQARGTARASTDGQTWVPLAQLPEVQEAVVPPALGERQVREQREAARITRELARIQGMRVHELFGVPHDAPPHVLRQGYVALARPFHPSQVPAGAHPELQAASAAMFDYLTRRLAEAAPQVRLPGGATPLPLAPGLLQGAPPPARTPPPGQGPAPVAAAARTPPPGRGPAPVAPRPSLSSRPSGLTPVPLTPVELAPSARRADLLEARVAVTRETSGIFRDHKLVNLASGGVYIPHPTPPPLGTQMDVLFDFRDASREVRARGKVICENSVGRDAERGFGLRLDQLSPDDKAFLQRYVSAAR